MHFSYTHCVQSARIWSYSGQYFPTFGLNTMRYSVSPHKFSPNAGKYGAEKLRIQTLFMQVCLIQRFEKTKLAGNYYDKTYA